MRYTIHKLKKGSLRKGKGVLPELVIVTCTEKRVKVSATTISSDGETGYYPGIVFRSKTKSKKDKVYKHKVKTKESQTRYRKTLKESKTHVKVKCTCSDWNWTYAHVACKAGALLGDMPNLPKPKGTGKPRNPKNKMGLCKHLQGLVRYMRLKKILSTR